MALGVAAVGLEGLVQAVAQRAVREHADLAHVEAKAVVAVGAARAQVELVAQLQVLALVLLDALELAEQWARSGTAAAAAGAGSCSGNSSPSSTFRRRSFTTVFSPKGQ